MFTCIVSKSFLSKNIPIVSEACWHFKKKREKCSFSPASPFISSSSPPRTTSRKNHKKTTERKKDIQNPIRFLGEVILDKCCRKRLDCFHNRKKSMETHTNETDRCDLLQRLLSFFFLYVRIIMIQSQMFNSLLLSEIIRRYYRIIITTPKLTREE